MLSKIENNPNVSNSNPAFADLHKPNRITNAFRVNSEMT